MDLIEMFILVTETYHSTKHCSLQDFHHSTFQNGQDAGSSRWVSGCQGLGWESSQGTGPKGTSEVGENILDGDLALVIPPSASARTK